MVQEEVDVEYISLRGCIKNTSADATVLKEYQLNASRSNADTVGPGLRFGVLVLLLRKSYLTLCDTMDRSPPGSSVHWVFQARILEWVAIPFSKGSSSPRD